MKKLFNHSIAALAAFAMILSCAKDITAPEEEEIPAGEEEIQDPADDPAIEDNPAGKEITFSVNLSDELLAAASSISTASVGSKVEFDPIIDANTGKIVSMELKWEPTDKLLVTDASNDSNSATFDIVPSSISADGQTASFTGTLPSGSAFNVSVVDGKTVSNLASQSQPSDGVSNVKYWAEATNVASADFENEFTLSHLSGVLAFTVKMPSTAAADDVMSISLTASEDIFFGGNELTIKFDQAGDADSDGILYFFATLPAANCGNIPACTMMVKINAPGSTTHKVYTRYIEQGAKTLTAGKVNNFNINASHADQHAGLCSGSDACDGSSAKPYLIADGYQLAAINSYASQSSKTYFKLIDDIDMSGITHTPINTSIDGFAIEVDFDGNNKTISNLGKDLFYVLKGSVYDLTLDHSSITSRGILAEYVQGTGHTVTNVTVSSGTIATNSEKTGGLIGQINKGTAGTTSVTISNCNVVNTKVTVSSSKGNVGGLVGFADAKIEIDNCSVSNTDSGTYAVTGAAANTGGLVGGINTNATNTSITSCAVSGINVTGTSVVGGFVGYANALVSISGSNFTGGTVTCSGQFVGGFIGSTGDYSSTVKNCQVEAATINVNSTNDARGGGFIGQLQNNVTISGCTVGTSETKVTVNTKEPTKTNDVFNVINTGGFVGVCYGKITKNGEVRSKAYVKITSTNAQGTPLKLGGFVGYHAGNIEYSDAIVDMTSLKGQHIGGFAGYDIKNNSVRLGRLDNCTTDGPVTGNNYTGGFVGYVDSGSPAISNCSASGSVTAQSGCGGFVGQTMTGVFTDCSTSMTCSFSGSNNGGFVGQIHGGTMTGCSSSGSVTATGGSTYGGFVGLITNNGTTLDKCFSESDLTDEIGSYNGGFCGTIEKGTVLIKRCYASGNVTSDKTYAAGFIGIVHHTSNALSVTIENCYSTGNIIKSNQIRGGFIAQVGTVTTAKISNCYASGAVVGSFRLGGLIGNVGSANVTVEHCAAWNSEVTASSYGSANWSSAAVVGTAFPTSTLTDNYRRPGMPVLAYWGNVTGYTYLLADDYQHANVDASNSLIKQNGAHSTATALASGQDGYPQFPYHGKVEAGKTLSQLASSTLGWDGSIWNFNVDPPTLQ